MLDRLGSDDLTEWMAWERLIGPLGSARMDFLVAHLCCTMAHCWTTSKGRGPKVEDFLLFKAPWATSRRGALTNPDDIVAMFRAMADAGSDRGVKIRGKVRAGKGRVRG